LLVVAGVGYYFYSYYTAQKAPAKPAVPAVPGAPVPGRPAAPAAPGVRAALRRKTEEDRKRKELVKKLRETRRAKLEAERQKIFEKFGKPGELPPEKVKLKKIEEEKLEKAENAFDRLEELTKRESDFEKLERLTSAVKKKPVFDKLVEFSTSRPKSGLKELSSIVEKPKPRAKVSKSKAKKKAKPKPKAKPKKKVQKKKAKKK
jgi:hypothetical protein